MWAFQTDSVIAGRVACGVVEENGSIVEQRRNTINQDYYVNLRGIRGAMGRYQLTETSSLAYQSFYLQLMGD